VIIGISKYKKAPYKNLPNIETVDVPNFKKAFQDQLRYKIEVSKNEMTKPGLLQFVRRVKEKYKLITNFSRYDGIIIILCGHGENGNSFVTSDGQLTLIDDIRSEFDGAKLESMSNFPKIFFIDICRSVRMEKKKVLPATAVTTTRKIPPDEKKKVLKSNHQTQNTLTVKPPNDNHHENQNQNQIDENEAKDINENNNRYQHRKTSLASLADETLYRGNAPTIHKDKGFATIWWTTNGHPVPDQGLLSVHWEKVISNSNNLTHHLDDLVIKLSTSLKAKHYCAQIDKTLDCHVYFSRKPT